MESTAVITKRLIKALKALKSAADDRERKTQLTREIAQASVDLREHFLDGKGQPDWAARTWPYREAMRNIYQEAGYSTEEKDTTQAAVRYHVGTIVRARMTPEQIEDAGLLDDAPIDRTRTGRGVRSALLAAATAPGGGDTDAPRSLASAYLILQRVDKAALAEMDDAGRGQVQALAERIGSLAEEIARAVDGAG